MTERFEYEGPFRKVTWQEPVAGVLGGAVGAGSTLMVYEFGVVVLDGFKAIIGQESEMSIASSFHNISNPPQATITGGAAGGFLTASLLVWGARYATYRRKNEPYLRQLKQLKRLLKAWEELDIDKWASGEYFSKQDSTNSDENI